MKNETDKAIAWVVKNWEKIPERFKASWQHSSAVIEGLPLDEHVVVVLIDRQKPSVEASWDFDEERIGITRKGKVVWGFDSGCSCPSPWHDSYPKCYSCTNTWKEFEVELSKFDPDVVQACLAQVEEIKKAL